MNPIGFKTFYTSEQSYWTIHDESESQSISERALCQFCKRILKMEGGIDICELPVSNTAGYDGIDEISYIGCEL